MSWNNGFDGKIPASEHGYVGPAYAADLRFYEDFISFDLRNIDLLDFHVSYIVDDCCFHPFHLSIHRSEDILGSMILAYPYQLLKFSLILEMNPVEYADCSYEI